MTLADLTDSEKVEHLLAELQDAGETLQRYGCGDNRALRTVREMRGAVDPTHAEPA
ncbi:hypothetical protein [Acidovorax sp. Leaf84]|uniref:hypothetical protein n=1 Tax=Acidovorax sp. Leaf84 TaxID=1736240 RepID=UPI000AD3D372|nr:hypothetical protein [Acidovorax sp. Leaf84]